MARRLLETAAVLALSAACAGRTATPVGSAPSAAAPAAVARPAGDPTALRYAAGVGGYRIETTVHTVQDMMGQVQTVDAHTTQLLNAALTADGANILAVIRIDSITSDQGPADALAGIIGQQFRLVVTPQGRFVTSTPPDTSAAAVQISTGLRDFLPLLPPAIAAGATWTDTLAMDVPAAGGMALSTRTIRTHRVVGWEDRDGMRALHLSVASTYTLSGTGDANGQPLEIQGTGTGMAERYVSAAGIYLGAVESDSANISVNVVSMGMTVPVTRTQRATTTRVP